MTSKAGWSCVIAVRHTSCPSASPSITACIEAKSPTLTIASGVPVIVPAISSTTMYSVISPALLLPSPLSATTISSVVPSPQSVPLTPIVGAVALHPQLPTTTHIGVDIL